MSDRALRLLEPYLALTQGLRDPLPRLRVPVPELALPDDREVVSGCRPLRAVDTGRGLRLIDAATRCGAVEEPWAVLVPYLK
jgi:hypothetical protein